MLQRIQRRATETVLELRDISYDDCVKEFGLTTLEIRKLRGVQIEMFNTCENIENFFFLT